MQHHVGTWACTAYLAAPTCETQRRRAGPATQGFGPRAAWTPKPGTGPGLCPLVRAAPSGTPRRHRRRCWHRSTPSPERSRRRRPGARTGPPVLPAAASGRTRCRCGHRTCACDGNTDAGHGLATMRASGGEANVHRLGEEGPQCRPRDGIGRHVGAVVADAILLGGGWARARTQRESHPRAPVHTRAPHHAQPRRAHAPARCR